MSKLIKTLILFLGFLFALFVTWKLTQPSSEKVLLRQILNLDQLPESIKELSCKADGAIDVMYSCYFEVGVTSREFCYHLLC
jgi:hypothetical protein